MQTQGATWASSGLGRPERAAALPVDWSAMEARSGIAVVTGRRRPRRFRPVHRLRLMALRVLDPISWYVQKQERLALQTRRNSPHLGRPSQVSSPGPTVPVPRDGPSTRAELLARTAAFAERTAYLMEHHGEYFRAKAAQLVADGEASLTTTAGVIQGRLVRFWNGALLEISKSGGPSRSVLSIDRKVFRGDPVPWLARSLAHSVGDLGPDVRPLG